MKSVAVHLVLALVGLGLAYRGWTKKDEKEKEGSADAVVLVECGVDEFAALTLTQGAKTSTLARKKDGAGEYFWVRTVTKAQAPVQAPAQAPSPEPDRVDEFPAEKTIGEFLDAVLPFEAKRSLGQLSGEQLKETKLEKPTDGLELECGGKKHAFDLGAAAFGSGDYYLRPKGGGTVYLVDQKVVRDLGRAETELMLRELVVADMKDVEHLVVAGEGREKKLLQRNRANPAEAEWVDAAEPDRRNELYGNWFGKFRGMRVDKYLKAGEAPGQEYPEPRTSTPVGKLTFLGASGQTLETVELATATGETPAYYARSGATRAWVRLVPSTAKPVQSDLAPILGLESTPSD